MIKNENELVQYYIVNKDLINNYNMSVGKIAAQVGHAARLIALRDQNKDNFKEWLSIEYKTVVLKASEKEITKLKEKIPESILVIDNGHTEIPIQSKTVLVLPVMSRVEAHEHVKRFRVL